MAALGMLWQNLLVGGVSLSPSMNAVIKYNPEGAATNRLYLWYRETRPKTELKVLSSTMGDANSLFGNIFSAFFA